MKIISQIKEEILPILKILTAPSHTNTEIVGRILRLDIVYLLLPHMAFVKVKLLI
jgi:hypothetical protein